MQKYIWLTNIILYIFCKRIKQPFECTEHLWKLMSFSLCCMFHSVLYVTCSHVALINSLNFDLRDLKCVWVIQSALNNNSFELQQLLQSEFLQQTLTSSCTKGSTFSHVCRIKFAVLTVWSSFYRVATIFLWGPITDQMHVLATPILIFNLV